MRRLGISIYPEKDSEENIRSYLSTAAEFGAKRIFSCLLSVTKEPEEIKKEFRRMNQYAHELGFEVVLDVSPKVFAKLGISYSDLSFFQEIEADGIRLDQGFTGNEEAMMTFNPQGLSIEINMSNDTHTVDTIMDVIISIRIAIPDFLWIISFPVQRTLRSMASIQLPLSDALARIALDHGLQRKDSAHWKCIGTCHWMFRSNT